MSEAVSGIGDGRARDPAAGVGTPAAVLVEAARETWRADNRADAARLAACYALWRQCERDLAGDDDAARPGHAVIDPFDVCCTHLAAAFAMSCGRAETMLSLAVDLTERYPDVLAALAAGRLDQRVAEVLARQLRTVDDAVIGRVQREAVAAYLAVIEGGEVPTLGAVRDMIDEIIKAHDADGIRLRREDASRDRGVRLNKGADGMSTVSAILANDEAAVLAEALDARAAEFADPAGDAGADMSRYSLGDRRADALMSLALGGRSPASGAASPGSVATTGPAAGADPAAAPEPAATPGPAPGSAGVTLRPAITVFAEGATGTEGSTDTEDATGAGGVTGAVGAVVRFPRSGEAAVEALLEMLAASAGASIECMDAAIGAADGDEQRLRYRPGAALARRVRLRDGTCRHPGCTASADYADLDHVVPFNPDDPAAGGHTEECNLLCLCRRHHRLKTFLKWRYRMEPDGTLRISTDDGKTMTTRPSGPLADYRRELSRRERPTRHRRAPARALAQSAPAEPTYWHRRNLRIRAEREAVAEANAATRDATCPRPSRPGLAYNPDSVQEQRLVDLLDPPPF